MKQDRWRRIDELFGAALERREGAERAAFLDEACAGDAALRLEVEKMFKFDRRAADFLETPVFAAAAKLISSEAETLLSLPDEDEKRASRDASPGLFSSGSIDDARFVPGDVLANRYRIVGLLGRGGMGEVYRADDLKLKQAVALKFLPESLSADGPALARFYQEVSVARQISHRHVCRVYDIGEYSGLHFLTMEYVRGEELSSLLKRIGRLPQDKALETARQLCAGLAAIHEKKVLHRDLKPANIMLDEQGDVRITDFGIATLAEGVSGRDAMAGTPAYMSPEQLSGTELSARSDIYSLGLILYEVFTGKKAFEAASLPELLRLRRSESAPTNPSKLIADLDPLIERVILRCLEKEPSERPSSALQVAAALPGGDPLAAALAAGETPSPEMVIAAPKEGSLRPGRALALLAIVLVGFTLIVLFSGRAMLHRFVSLKRSPDDLKARASEVAKRFGITAQPVDAAYGFVEEREYLEYIYDYDPSPERWEKLRMGQPSALSFWYRQGQRHFDPYGDYAITYWDPPNIMSGMVLMKLDTTGRLTYYEAVPAQVDEMRQEEGQPTAAIDWSSLFQEAGLEQANFRPSESRWVPPHQSDARAAWDGSYPGRPELPLRIEAASYRGRPIYFEMIGPWQRPARQIPFEERGSAKWFTVALFTLYFGTLGLGALLAWRNLRLGRGDRRGALRLALFVFTIKMISWVFFTHHVPTVGEVAGLLTAGLRSAVYWACFFGLMYLAMEPFIRRRWPEWLISWGRLLSGNFRDPLVGRDVLIGAAFGVGFILANYLRAIVPPLFGQPMSAPSTNSNLLYELGLLGLNGFVPLFINQIIGSLLTPFIIISLLLFLVMLLRRKRLGIAAGWIILYVALSLNFANKTALGLALGLLLPTLIITAVARYGVLTLISMTFFVHLFAFYPITTEFSAWYATGFILELVLLVALTLYGFFTSLAGQPLLRGSFLED
ncbi:MAG TPA: serine/threonine-protein kinase [Pyrinomonadaceae bacterium]|nr:serine/threonine-protein kinase [Pyrinomonadaceae bacterium]